VADALSRRQFLGLAAGAAAAGVTGCSGAEVGPPSPPSLSPVPGTTVPPDLPPVPPIDGMPFGLGVASGDPLPDRVVLWTRLAPRPLDGGGMPDAPAPVLWEVATDERFAGVVARGAHVAEPRWAHSVHVDAVGLRPDSWYWYRFRVGDHVSPVGRTRTAPAAGAAVSRARFGVGSCQNWTHGHYSAYPHLVDEDVDLMIWLGDYIYEGAAAEGAVRPHRQGTAVSLDDYRARYGLYTGDPQLQAARAAMPWAVLWDDHEVLNNYGGDRPPVGAAGPGTDLRGFALRRAAAYQAWWEHQPVRLDPPVAGSLRVHRALDWGALARILVLDERQYRSDPACPDARGGVGDCPERTDPRRSMLGSDQRDWLLGQLDGTTATWNVLANEVVMSRYRLGGLYNLDQWDGFEAERRLVAGRLAARPGLNPLVLTGDIHAFAVNDVKVDHDRPDEPVVATEIVAGSVSSVFGLPDAAVALLRGLPDVRLFDGARRGYAVVDLERDRAVARLRAVDTVMQPTSPIGTLATVEVEAGRPGGHVTS
jgi:alkaline phosphatase D